VSFPGELGPEADALDLEELGAEDGDELDRLMDPDELENIDISTGAAPSQRKASSQGVCADETRGPSRTKEVPKVLAIQHRWEGATVLPAASASVTQLGMYPYLLLQFSCVCACLACAVAWLHMCRALAFDRSCSRGYSMQQHRRCAIDCMMCSYFLCCRQVMRRCSRRITFTLRPRIASSSMFSTASMLAFCAMVKQALAKPTPCLDLMES
jgi:hypothetical protein